MRTGNNGRRTRSSRFLTGRRRESFCFAIGAVLAGTSLLASCSKTLTVAVSAQPPCDQPNLFTGLGYFTVRTEGANLDAPRQQTFSAASGSGDLKSIPVTSAGRITMLAGTGSPSSAPTLAGAVGDLDLTGDASSPASVTVVLGPIASFISASQGSTCLALNSGRQGHTSTLLNDGRVLVVGGEQYQSGAFALLNSTEIYSPNGGGITVGPTMPDARAYHTASLLGNGHVLICGGEGAGNQSLSTCYLFDPQTTSFLPGGLMLANARTQHTATVLGDGRVVFAGGVTLPTQYLDTTEIYDPSHQNMTSGPTMTVARAQHTASLLADGQTILFAGGQDGSSVRSELEEWQTSGTVAAGTLTEARYGHAAGSFSDGRILLMGGYTDLSVSGTPSVTNGVEVFDPSSGTNGSDVCPTGLTLTSARGDLSAATLTVSTQSSIVVFGGTTGNGTTSNVAELITAGTNESCEEIAIQPTAGTLEQARTQANAVVLSGGDVLVVGGSSSIGSTIGEATTAATSAELFISPR